MGPEPGDNIFPNRPEVFLQPEISQRARTGKPEARERDADRERPFIPSIKNGEVFRLSAGDVGRAGAHVPANE